MRDNELTRRIRGGEKAETTGAEIIAIGKSVLARAVEKKEYLTTQVETDSISSAVSILLNTFIPAHASAELAWAMTGLAKESAAIAYMIAEERTKAAMLLKEME